MKAPLRGKWRHSFGILICGSMRIAKQNFDTDTSIGFKNEVLDWMCQTLNESQSIYTHRTAIQKDKE